MNDQPSPTDMELFNRVENEAEGTFKLFFADGVDTEDNIAQQLNN